MPTSKSMPMDYLMPTYCSTWSQDRQSYNTLNRGRMSHFCRCQLRREIYKIQTLRSSSLYQRSNSRIKRNDETQCESILMSFRRNWLRFKMRSGSVGESTDVFQQESLFESRSWSKRKVLADSQARGNRSAIGYSPFGMRRMSG